MFYRNEPQVAVLLVKSYTLSCVSITIIPPLTNTYLLLTINYLIQTLYVFWAPMPQKLVCMLKFMTVCSPREVILFPIKKKIIITHNSFVFLLTSAFRRRVTIKKENSHAE